MRYPYYPGCTLYTKAKNLDQCARQSAQILGFELQELETWNCCGAIYSTVTDDLAAQVGPIRNLVQARKMGNSLVTLCAACYNVLLRSHNFLFAPGNEKTRKRLLEFLEEPYDENMKVLHYLEVLKNDIGWDKIKVKVKKNLKGLKVAAYYGCLLLRPAEELKFDDPDNPKVMDELMATLGAEPIDFPFKGECCGGYILVNAPDIALKCSKTILDSIIAAGAECVITSCPLCQYNIDNQQKLIREKSPGFKKIPVFYFTQLLGLALGLKGEILALDNHYVDPKPLLIQKGLING
ncbi:MAG: CoB--CoM heterodisulfide reductase iron-sulfur subunit B family protein [candidate division WOR-3 bacterium]